MDAARVVEPRRLRRVVLTVAGLNLGYFFVEVSVALAIGSVSLLADSVDFLEDTAINLLIALALGWPLRRRAVAGHAMALVTAWTGSGWPDIVLGCVIALVSSRAAWEVWELAGEERLAARALAGDDLDG